MECSEEKPEKICQFWIEKIVQDACRVLSDRIIKLESIASLSKWLGTTGAGILLVLIGFFFGANSEFATMKSDIEYLKKKMDRLVPDKKGKSLTILPIEKEVSYCDFLKFNQKKNKQI